MTKPLEIIKYPFSLGAALNRSFSSPGIVHKLTEDLFASRVKDWHELPPLTKTSSSRRYKGLRNYAAVKEAVTKLGTSIARAQWNGSKPLTLGGDHTQGIATVKASALILTAKAIINNEITCKDSGLPDALQQVGDKGQIGKLGKLISDAAANGVITKKSLNAFLETIAVIWVDSHADYNDRHTSGSGNIHGMSLASCTGRDIGGIENLFAGDVLRLKPENLYVLCARDIDDTERELMDKDGVNYKDWEMTKPGKLRSHTDLKNPKTLKKALNAILKKLKDKHIILSVDIDAIHAGLHKSPYGLESVAATGTPMGLTSTDIKGIFKTASQSENEIIRLNTQEKSPAGPEAGDMFEALQNIMNHKNIVAADLSEISPAAGKEGRPLTEKLRGLTLQTSIKTLSAMIGADIQETAEHLTTKKRTLIKLISGALKAEAQQSSRSH